jgi:hypothetical protein
MSPSSLFQEGEASPAAPIEQLAGGLAQGVVQCVIGLALGVLAAGLMRHARVHWSWAVVALGLVLLLGSSLTVSSTTLTFAAACAAVLARRWQRREMEAGGDLAAGVGASSTPWTPCVASRGWSRSAEAPARGCSARCCAASSRSVATSAGAA